MTQSITEEYFQLTSTYTNKYGERTIVLLQVGAFFEVYGLKHNNTITHSQIEEFSQICQLAISEKNATHDSKPIMMAGFRDYTLEKYLQKLTENDYTAVVYTQEKTGKQVNRKFHAVYSPGTFVSYDTESSQTITNNIMCIWIEKYQSITQNKNASIVFGVAVINIFTGKSQLSEYQTTYYINPSTFDELERCISTYNPNEIIINSMTLPENTIDTIIQYIGIKNAYIHKNCCTAEIIQKCSQQTYIHHILKTFFGEESINVCVEFSNSTIATQAYCYLLHFVQEHNPDLVRKIEFPIFRSTSQIMLLANHTLKQLNIINDTSFDIKSNYSSVMSFLNKCATPMGKRLFQYHIMHPTYDNIWLQKEYDITEFMTSPDNTELLNTTKKHLIAIKDIEKINRQIVLKKIYPSSIYNLYSSLQIIREIYSIFSCISPLNDYLGNEFTNLYKDITDMLTIIDKYLKIALCKNLNTIQTFENSIIQKTISLTLDKLTTQYEENLKSFHEIQDFLNKIMRTKESDESEYIKTHTTEKSGMSLQITKKRSTTLKTMLTEMQPNKLTLSNGLSFSTHEIKFTNASSTTCEIDIPCLHSICKTLLYSGEEIDKEIFKAYHIFLNDFENMHLKNVEKCVKYISKIDLIVCKANIAINYNYCKPNIQASQKSFVDAKQLRHVLIEHIQTNELYVANDICLNDTTSGILLYGTNAVGKTSLIRALGISVIMAQAGLFVPCSEFTYCPYKSIFSRILGNDNLFKGMSTFAVEMSELRMILKNVDQYSLILGDELCSGTETESALSIFVSGLLDLHAKECSFIFATHFHEIIRFDEIKSMTRLSLKHMAVRYDRELDCLVYDRILNDGPGNRMYGLEVCKSLYLPEDFLEKAMEIRTKYFPEMRGELANNMSSYSAKKIKGICELCKSNIGEEIHHLQPQKDADDNGFIGSIHKNHPANLMTLCEGCHQKMHKTTARSKKTKTTKGYVISEIVNQPAHLP
jgi:DNA mismatch repair protein MutS